MNTHWSDEYACMLNDCEKRESKLSDWEIGFIDSISMQIAAGRIPTAKQIEKLEAIWERVTA